MSVQNIFIECLLCAWRYSGDQERQQSVLSHTNQGVSVRKFNVPSEIKQPQTGLSNMENVPAHWGSRHKVIQDSDNRDPFLGSASSGWICSFVTTWYNLSSLLAASSFPRWLQRKWDVLLTRQRSVQVLTCPADHWSPLWLDHFGSWAIPKATTGLSVIGYDMLMGLNPGGPARDGGKLSSSHRTHKGGDLLGREKGSNQ